MPEITVYTNRSKRRSRSSGRPRPPVAARGGGARHRAPVRSRPEYSRSTRFQRSGRRSPDREIRKGSNPSGEPVESACDDGVAKLQDELAQRAQTTWHAQGGTDVRTVVVEQGCRGSLIDRTVVHRPENASPKRCASHPVEQAHRESRDRRQRVGRRDAQRGVTLARFSRLTRKTRVRSCEPGQRKGMVI